MYIVQLADIVAASGCLGRNESASQVSCFVQPLHQRLSAIVLDQSSFRASDVSAQSNKKWRLETLSVFGAIGA